MAGKKRGQKVKGQLRWVMAAAIVVLLGAILGLTMSYVFTPGESQKAEEPQGMVIKMIPPPPAPPIPDYLTAEEEGRRAASKTAELASPEAKPAEEPSLEQVVAQARQEAEQYKDKTETGSPESTAGTGTEASKGPEAAKEPIAAKTEEAPSTEPEGSQEPPADSQQTAAAPEKTPKAETKAPEPKKETAEKKTTSKQELAPKKTEKPSLQDKPSKPYTVRVGSYKNSENALTEAERFRRLGIPVFVAKADLGDKGVWQRVLVGEFQTKVDAEAFQKYLEKNYGVKEAMVMRSSKIHK